MVAERRVDQLLQAEASVTVIAPELSDALRSLVQAAHIEHQPTRFEDQSLSDYWLVVAATNDHALNQRVAAAAEREKRFCNVVDSPELCSFIMPAIIDRDPITIAIVQ